MAGDSILITRGNGTGPKNVFSNQAWKLTVPTMEWTALPDLNVARADHASTCVGNHVYVLGGWPGCDDDGGDDDDNDDDYHDNDEGYNDSVVPADIEDDVDDPLQSVEYLDSQTGLWHATCDMPSPDSLHAAVSYNKRFIYVFGGFSVETTFMLDTETKKWSRKCDMPTGCLTDSSVVYRDRIYVLGNHMPSENLCQTCLISYDPDQDQWETHSRPTMQHIGSSTVVYNDRILLCGKNASVIEEYNPDTDT